MSQHPWARRASATALATVFGVLTLATPASSVTADSPTAEEATTTDTRLPLDQLTITSTPTDADLARPSAIATPDDGSGRLLITEKNRGTVRVHHPENGLSPDPLLDISDRITAAGNEQGLLGITTPPDFQKSPEIYVAYTAAPDGTLTLSRFPLDSADQEVIPAESEEVLLTVEHDEYTNHNGGAVAFGPDGYLYWSLGDGGHAGDSLDNGQNLTTLLGSIVRLDVSRSCGQLAYCVPEDNPFVSHPEARPEIWAYGLRNPWRFSFDPEDGSMWIADVGQGRHEEVNHLAPGEGGANLGWPCREGPEDFDEERCDPAADYVEPVFSYTHEGTRCSVTGGVVYRGEKFAELAGGTYVMADYCSGDAWGIRPTADGGHVTEHIGQLPIQVTTFGTDPAGEPYVVTDLPGQLHRVGFAAAVHCSVDYRVDDQWADGFTASVGVTNTGDWPIDGWELAWDFPGDQQVTTAWQAEVTQDGSTVTARDVGWNGVIDPGDSRRFGIHGSVTGSNAAPSEFTLNGTVCAG